MAQPASTLSGTRVTLRPIRPDDRARLREILSEPEVERWWGMSGLDRAADGLYDPGVTVYVVEVGGEIAGAIQYYEEADPDYRHAGIDIFLGTAHQGRGLGTEAVRLLARYLFDERGHHRLVIDPAVANTRAIASYRKAGFRPVGVMRRYERGPGGTWHDGLLMDMLGEDLVRE